MKTFLIVLFASVFTTVVFTWPFAAKVTTFYPDYGRFGDYIYAGSVLWYNQKAILTGKILNQKGYFHGFLLYPQPYTLAYTDHSLVPSLIFAPLYWTSKNLVFSINTLTILALTFSFISSFYTINYFLNNKFASTIGAVVFTFNPLTFAHFPQHFNLLHKYFLPPLFLFAYLFFKKPTYKNGFLLSLFFSLNALSVIYYFIFTLVLIPVLSIPFFIRNIRTKHYNYFLNLCKCACSILLFLPLIWYFTYTYLLFAQKEMAQRSIQENAFYSARLIDWISSTPHSLIYGNFTKFLDASREYKQNQTDYLSYEERTLFLNILPMFLFLLAISKWKKLRLPLLYYLLILGTSILMTFGPYFQGWNSKSSNIKLPFYYLHQFIYTIQAIRVPTRFAYVTYVPFSLVVAAGACFVFGKRKKHNFLIFVAMLLMLYIENYNVNNFSEQSTMLEKFQQANKDGKLGVLADKRVLHMPPTFSPPSRKETIYLNWTVLAGEINATGYSAYWPAEQVHFWEKLNERLDEEALRRLSALEIDYVVFHKDLMNKRELDQFTMRSPLYKDGVIFNNDSVSILEVKRYNYAIQICTFPQNFTIQLMQATDQNYPTRFYVLSVKNNSVCYLPNVYEDKYRSLEFFTEGKRYTVKLKLPPVIGPLESVILAEPDNNLKVN